MQQVYDNILNDARYQKNILWGKPRNGHPEGTILAHINELEKNLSKLAERDPFVKTHYMTFKVLIHVHDTFKPDAEEVPIPHPKSHASQAAAFLKEMAEGIVPEQELAELVQIVQYHDEPFALWNQTRRKGKYNQARFDALIKNTRMDLFVPFLVIDGCTEGKGTAPLRWFLEMIGMKPEDHLIVP
jgi:hypothetical protein